MCIFLVISKYMDSLIVNPMYLYMYVDKSIRTFIKDCMHICNRDFIYI